MISLFFLKLPVTLASKVNLMRENAFKMYGSELLNVGKDKFIGDQLTLESLLPEWIIQEYEADTNNVKIVPILKNYLRWLFSLKYGYGAYIEWETLRSPMEMPEELLQGLAEFYFPGEDFSSVGLVEILPNIRQFSIQVDSQYFDIKGTTAAIKYVLVTLLGYDYTTTAVSNYGSNVIQIVADISEEHKAFLQRSVLPAGMSYIYTTP